MSSNNSKKEIVKVDELLVKSGEFNTDEIIAVTILKSLNSKMKVIKSQFYSNEENKLLMGFENGDIDYISISSKKDKYGNLYSLTSLVWELYGRDYLVSMGFSKVEAAYNLFYEKYIEKISVGTRKGYRHVKFFHENDFFKQFIPNWYEIVDNNMIANIQFELALNAASIILENWTRLIYEEIEFRDKANEIWDNAKANSNDGIYVLERHIPWQSQIKRDPESDVKIIIFKSNRGGYNLVSKNSEEIKILDSEYLTFIHPTKYMGVADTLSNAILVAKQTINYCNLI